MHPIANHPLWPVLRKWIRSNRGSQNQSRFVVHDRIPDDLRRKAIAIRCVCHCGIPYSPVRASRGSDTLQVYMTGPRFDGHLSCSYKKIAREWALWMYDETQTHFEKPAPVQSTSTPRLF